MRSRLFFVTVVCVLACAGLHARGQTGPNIVFILADDQRADSIAALGNEEIITPSLDALVARGTTFTRAYCMGSNSGAVCAPSRAMMMTGQRLQAVKPHIWNLPATMKTLPEMLRDAGYATFGTGKWHSGKASFARGFTHGGSIFFGGMGSHTTLRVHEFDPSGVYANDMRKPLHAFSSTAFVDEAIEFLETRPSDKPFFAFVSMTAPHDPRTPPEAVRALYDETTVSLPKNFMPVHPFHNGEMTIRDEALAPWPRTADDTRKQLIDYYAMITHMDEQIGRLIESIESLGLADDTWIVFASDHGLAVGSHGLMGKQNMYEHSVRAPIVIAGPGVPAGEQIDELVYLLDLMPTMCAMAGLAPPEGTFGIDLSPLVSDKPVGQNLMRRSLLLEYTSVQRALVEERYKLIVYPRINRLQLFDLHTDPDEIEDLASDPAHHETIERMMADLLAWQDLVGETAPLRTDPPQSARFDHVHAERKRTGG